MNEAAPEWQVSGMGRRAPESARDLIEVRGVDVDAHRFDAFVRKELPNVRCRGMLLTRGYRLRLQPARFGGTRMRFS